MQIKSNEKGFTLIEMLLVLTVVMVVSSSILFVTTSSMENLEERRFFRQLHLDIQKVQSIAIAEQKYTYMLFFVEDNRDKYVVRSQNIDLFSSEFPTSIRLAEESKLNEIYFHPTGNVKQFGNLTFITKHGEKKMTINIGQGRLNYEE